MGYGDFTPELVRHKFGLVFRDQPLFANVGTAEPSAWLREALVNGLNLGLLSEKARSEFIVAPVLLTCQQMSGHRYHIFSGLTMNIDPDKGLQGEFDFMLARSLSAHALQAPLLVVLEAKKNDIEEGLGQCAAQLLAARMYNEREGWALPVLYGCITTGESWQFVKLEESSLFIHPERYAIKEVGTILWFLIECLKAADQHARRDAAA